MKWDCTGGHGASIRWMSIACMLVLLLGVSAPPQALGQRIAAQPPASPAHQSLAPAVTRAVPPAAAGAWRRVTALEAYGRLPLSFEANQGQTDPQVDFLARGRGYTVFLTATEAVLVTQPPSARSRGVAERAGATRPTRHVLRMKLGGADPDAAAAGLDSLPGKAHYFLGAGEHWRTNVPTYARVKYRDVYPGVDVVYYGNQRHLEHDFVVAPGADPSAIRLAFEGLDGTIDESPLRIDANGDLILSTAGGETRLRKPHVYQEIGGVRRTVAGGYVLLPARPGAAGTHEVGFDLAAYDAGEPLVIDPVLLYATYLGSSGDDKGSTIAADVFGNAYVTGPTSSLTFPGPGGAASTALGSDDVFVAKLDPVGSSLVYAAYLGGSGAEGNANSFTPRIAVDAAGQAVVVGRTASIDFPTTPGAYSETCGGNAVYVAKLNKEGSQLLYATCLDGGGQDQALGVALGLDGTIHVTGDASADGFPMKNAFQSTFAGVRDFFVTKLDPTLSGDASLVYSTYFGGAGQEENFLLGIAVDAKGHVYVVGETELGVGATTIGPPFPGPTLVIAKFDPFAVGAASLLYSRYIDGSGASSIAVDAQGNAYVVSGFGLTKVDATAANVTTFPFPSRTVAVAPAGDRVFVDEGTVHLSTATLVPYGASGGQEAAIAVDATCHVYRTSNAGGTLETFAPLGPAQSTFGGGTTDAFIEKFRTIGAADPFAYIANFGADTVTVVDTSSNKVVDNDPSTPLIVDDIPVQTSPAGVAVGPDGKHVWVTNSGSGSVSVIDMTASPPAVTHIALGHVEPIAVVVAKSPNGRVTAYVADRHGPDTGTFDRGRVAMIDADPSSPTFKQQRPGSPLLPAQVGQHPTGLAVSPDGSKVYVTSLGSFAIPGAALAVIDTDTDQVVGGGPVQPIGIAFAFTVAATTDGSHLFVTGEEGSDPATSGRVAVLKTSDFTLAQLPGPVEGTPAPNPVPVGAQPVSVTAHPDGSRVYVTQFPTGKTLVLDANPASATFGKLLKEIPVGNGPVGIAAHPDGRRVYVTNANAGTLSVVDVEAAVTPASDVQVDIVPVGTMPGSFGHFIAPAENPDVDGDGIPNAVDGFVDGDGVFQDQSATASASFTAQHLCGTTSGVITDTNGLTVTIEVAGGLVAKATGAGGPATLTLCGGSKAVVLSAGDVVGLPPCGSFTVDVVSGPIEIALGTATHASVPSGATARVVEDAGETRIQNLGSTGTIDIVTMGVVTASVAPGGSFLFDEVPPEIQCNAPATITQRDTPASFKATATDNAGPASMQITGVSCLLTNRGGKQVDMTRACGARVVNDDTVAITRSGPAGSVISWSITATDASGNIAVEACQVEVVKAPSAGKEKGEVKHQGARRSRSAAAAPKRP